MIDRQNWRRAALFLAGVAIGMGAWHLALVLWEDPGVKYRRKVERIDSMIAKPSQDLIEEIISAGGKARSSWPALLRLASSRHFADRHFAYTVLPWIDRDGTYMPWFLVSGLNDGVWIVRNAALHGLTVIRFKDKRILPHVALFLEDEEPLLRLGAINVLGQYGGLAVNYVDKLERMLECHVENGEYPTIQESLVAAIRSIRGQ